MNNKVNTCFFYIYLLQNTIKALLFINNKTMHSVKTALDNFLKSCTCYDRKKETKYIKHQLSSQNNKKSVVKPESEPDSESEYESGSEYESESEHESQFRHLDSECPYPDSDIEYKKERKLDYQLRQHITINKDIVSILLKYVHASHDNALISPLNIQSVLAVIYYISEEPTDTALKAFFQNYSKTQIFNTFLTVNNMLKESPHVIKANYMIFSKNTPNKINKEYVDLVKEILTVSRADTCAELGNLFKSDTQNVFTIVDKNNSNHELGLESKYMTFPSFICFDSNWKNGFNTAYTSKSNFIGFNNISKTVDTMKMYEATHMYYADPVVRVLEMDCYDTNFAMGFILPTGLSKNFVLYTQLEIAYYVAQFEKKRIVEINIPKFQIIKKYSVKDFLQKQGLGELFDNCNLLKMTNSSKSKIIDVEQTVCINVSEGDYNNKNNIKPTVLSYSNNRNVQFIADRPFMYYVRHKNINIPIIVGIYQ